MAKTIDALIKARDAAKSVGLDGFNKHHRYRYATAESLLEEGREALSSAGLVLVPTGSDIVEMPSGKLVLRRKYVLSAGEDPIEISQDWPIVPGEGRPVDKATASADTTSLAYLIRDLLMIPRVEEGTGLDDDSRDAPPRPQQQPTATQQKTEQPPKMAEATRALVVKAMAAKDAAELDEISAGIKDAPAADKQIWLMAYRCFAAKLNGKKVPDQAKATPAWRTLAAQVGGFAESVGG